VNHIRGAGQLVLLTLLLHAPLVHAQPAPKVLIEQTIQEAFTVLRDAALRTQSKERLHKLRSVVDKAFDWEAMAKSSLGVRWRGLNEAQHKEFVEVFKELLAQRYMDDIDRFQGSEQLSVVGAEQDAELATVQTVLLTSSREKIPIDYTLHKTASGWRVDDVSIEGVSLVNHYRKTFAQFLTNKRFDELMQQLRRKLGVSAQPSPSSQP
jgi:phospholipid transport system substrate-binding protein